MDFVIEKNGKKFLHFIKNYLVKNENLKIKILILFFFWTLKKRMN